MQDGGEPGISWAFQNRTSATLLLTAFASQQPIGQTSDQRLMVLSDATKTSSAKLSLRDPVGSYPEGAKLLKGTDKSYILAPIGHIIEEKYSPYLRFNS